MQALLYCLLKNIHYIKTCRHTSREYFWSESQQVDIVTQLAKCIFWDDSKQSKYDVNPLEMQLRLPGNAKTHQQPPRNINDLCSTTNDTESLMVDQSYSCMKRTLRFCTIILNSYPNRRNSTHGALECVYLCLHV